MPRASRKGERAKEAYGKMEIIKTMIDVGDDCDNIMDELHYVEQVAGEIKLPIAKFRRAVVAECARKRPWSRTEEAGERGELLELEGSGARKRRKRP